MSRVGLVRADPPAAARSAVRLPSARPGPRDRSTLTPASILAFQRSAGNRAVGRRLQRKVTGDVLGGSVGIQFAEQLTPDEMREQVALLANALQSQKLDPTTREVLEQNLQELEEYASDAQIELPASTAYHLRKIIAALAGDAKRLVTQVKSLKNQRPTDLNWSIRWLDRVADAIIEAGTKVASGEKGGPNSAAEFAAAAKLLTGAIPMSKALAAHLAYLTVVTKVEEHYPHSWSSMMYTKLEVVRDAFTPLMGTIWSGDPTRFDKAVADLLEEVPSFSFDFSQFVDNLEEKMRKQHRFLQWLAIFELALLAFDIWMLPVAGRPGGPRGKPPTIGGIGGGGAAVAGGGVLVAVESLAALRRLIRLGVLTNPGLIKAVSGSGPPISARVPSAPPKPAQQSQKGDPSPGKGGQKKGKRADDEPLLSSKDIDKALDKLGKGGKGGKVPKPREAPVDLEPAVQKAIGNVRKSAGKKWLSPKDFGTRLHAELERMLPSGKVGRDWKIDVEKPLNTGGNQTVREWLRANGDPSKLETALNKKVLDSKVANLTPDVVLHGPGKSMLVWDLTARSNIEHLAKTQLYARILGKDGYLVRIGETYWTKFTSK